MADEDEDTLHTRITQLARSVTPVLAGYAAQVDREARFPAASVQALRDGGYLTGADAAEVLSPERDAPVVTDGGYAGLYRIQEEAYRQPAD